MAHRNIDRSAHTPAQVKFLTGEVNNGIGSVKKKAQESARLKALNDLADAYAALDASEESTAA